MEEIIRKILNSKGDSIIDGIVDEIKNKNIAGYGPVNSSGKLAESVEKIVEENRMQILIAEYADKLTQGRAPGKRPPVSVIMDWIDQKPIKFNPDDISKESLAFLIARKIGQVGNEVYRQFAPDESGLFSDTINDSLVDEIEKELADAAEIQVTSELLKGFEQ